MTAQERRPYKKLEKKKIHIRKSSAQNTQSNLSINDDSTKGKTENKRKFRP
jgi:hypothetical protein